MLYVIRQQCYLMLIRLTIKIMHGINDIIKGMAKSCNENPLLNVHNMVIAIPKIKVLGRKTFIKLKPMGM